MLLITDLPKNRSQASIRHALAKYGQIQKIALQSHTQHTNQATIDIIPGPKFDDIKNRWATIVGNVLVRIAIIDKTTNMDNPFKQRDLYSLRLKGISQETFTSAIMRAVQHTGAKSCYIPRNSKTGKRRNIAVVNFATAKDLEKATRRHIFMFGLKLKWESNRRGQEQNTDYRTSTQSEEEMSVDLKESDHNNTENESDRPMETDTEQEIPSPHTSKRRPAQQKPKRTSQHKKINDDDDDTSSSEEGECSYHTKPAVTNTPKKNSTGMYSIPARRNNISPAHTRAINQKRSQTNHTGYQGHKQATDSTIQTLLDTMLSINTRLESLEKTHRYSNGKNRPRANRS
jgi:hypothetical protein